MCSITNLISVILYLLRKIQLIPFFTRTILFLDKSSHNTAAPSAAALAGHLYSTIPAATDGITIQQQVLG